MGYKTKSMINQRGPGQLPGFDIENFNSINNNLKKLTTKFKGINETKAIQEIRKKEGPSGAINTSNLLQENLNKESSKSSSPTKAKKKLIEGRKLKRSQRKEVREAGKEAAKDVDTSFKKAELAGTDFNSLLIGTIQNLTSSSKASSKKRKVKKAAKDTKREMLSKGRPTEPMGELGNKKSQTLNAIKTSIAPEKSKVAEASAVTKNTNKTNTAPIPGSDPFLVPKTVFKEQVKPMYEYGPIAPKSGNTDMNKSFGRKIYDVTEQTGKDAAYALTRPASKQMEQDQRDYKTLGMTDEVIKVGKDFDKKRDFARGYLKNTPTPPSAIDVEYNKQRKIKSEERNLQIEQDKADARKRLKLTGVPMMGDGFNKGMLRKNKYKK